MRVQVQVALDGSTITVHVSRFNPAIPAARVAAGLVPLVETALQQHHARLASLNAAVPVPRLPVARPAAPQASPAGAPALVKAPVPEVSVPEVSVPEVSVPEVSVPAARPPAGHVDVPGGEVARGTSADDGTSDGVDRGVGDGRLEDLQRRALELLDDGVSDDEVCAQLGISRGRLLRWDNPLVAGGAR